MLSKRATILDETFHNRRHLEYPICAFNFLHRTFSTIKEDYTRHEKSVINDRVGPHVDDHFLLYNFSLICAPNVINQITLSIIAKMDELYVFLMRNRRVGNFDGTICSDEIIFELCVVDAHSSMVLVMNIDFAWILVRNFGNH